MPKKPKLSFLLFLILFALPGLGQEGLDEVYEDDPYNTTIIEETPPEDVYNPLNELKAMGYTDIGVTDLFDREVVEVLQKMFRNNQMQKASEEEIRTLIHEKAQGTLFEGFLRNRPKLVSVLVDVLRDKDALADLIGIFLRRDTLKFYFFIWLGLMISSYLIKKFVFSKKWNKPKTVYMSILLSLSVTGISLSVFYYLFDQEITSTTKILVDHWRRRNL